MTGAAKPIVTFGEVLLRLSPPGTQRLFQSPELRAWWGGAEANVAANLANLGLPAQHVSVLPDNAVGDAALGALRGEGVDTQHIARRGTRVGLYYLESGAGLRPLRVVYDRAHSAFSELDPAWFDWPIILRDARWLHLSGVSAALGESVVACMETAMDAAVALGVPVSLDLNHRPALWTDRDPRPVMQPLAARASLLIANPGAIEIMLGVKTDGESPEPPAALQATAEHLKRLLEHRAAIAVERGRTDALVEYALAFLEEARAGLAVARELPGEAIPDRLPEVLGRLRTQARDGDARRRTVRELDRLDKQAKGSVSA